MHQKHPSHSDSLLPVARFIGYVFFPMCSTSRHVSMTMIRASQWKHHATSVQGRMGQIPVMTLTLTKLPVRDTTGESWRIHVPIIAIDHLSQPARWMPWLCAKQHLWITHLTIGDGREPGSQKGTSNQTVMVGEWLWANRKPSLH